MKYAIIVNEVKESNNGLKGFASITFEDSFKITNVAIMENSETGKLFVSMPRYKTNEKDENHQSPRGKYTLLVASGSGRSDQSSELYTRRILQQKEKMSLLL